MVTKYRLGGLILTSWAPGDPTSSTSKGSNLESPAQIRAFAADLRAVGVNVDFAQVTGPEAPVGRAPGRRRCPQ